MTLEKEMYDEALSIYRNLQPDERCPSDIMRLMIDYENKYHAKKSPGISIEDFNNLPQKHINRIIDMGYQLYKYNDVKSYTNYENLKQDELVMVKFNGVNFETMNINKFIKLRKPEKTDWKVGINAHPPYHFEKRYTLYNYEDRR